MTAADGSARSLAWARRIAIGLAVAWALALLVVFALRITFALELEWMEGGVLHQALRLQRGEPIYPAPSRDFVPFLYTPLYPVVLAGLGKVFGLDYWLGRAVSIAATVAIAAGIWRAIQAAGKPPAHRWAAVGLFCSGYVFTFRWLDLGRPDALYMALTLWGLVLLAQSRGDHRKAVVAGILVALGFWTKQTAASFVLASGMGALLVAPRQLWSYALTIAVIDGGGVVLGNALTDGWLWHYIYELHQDHAFNRERFTTKTWGMFIHAAPFLVLLLVALALRWVRTGARSTAGKGWPVRLRDGARTHGVRIFWGLMALAGLLVSALGYATQWAEPNAFIPGVVLGAVFFGVVLPVGGRWETASLALVCAQMVFGAAVEPMYQPIQDDGPRALPRSYAWQRLGHTVPSGADRQRAAALRESLQRATGPVLALHRPWWSIIAGGQGHVGTMGINDVRNEDRRQIMAALQREVAQGRYESIWFEGEPPKWLLRSLDDYRVARRLQGRARARPFSGYMSEAGMVTPYRADQIEFAKVTDRSLPPGGRVIADFEDQTLQGFTVTGSAFGRRAVPGTQRRGRPVGPHGGRYLLSSAGVMNRPQSTGTATSPSFELPSAGRLEALIGTSGRRRGLRVVIVDEDGQREAELPIPRTRFTLEPVRWKIPKGWGGAAVRLRLVDQSERAALFFDDLWVIEGPDPDEAAGRG